MAKTFTTKDIRKVKDGWFSITVVDAMTEINCKYGVEEFKGYEGRLIEELHIDLAVSRYDKRDWIISSRSDFTLNQDSANNLVFAKKYTTMTEMKQAMVDLANNLANQ